MQSVVHNILLGTAYEVFPQLCTQAPYELVITSLLPYKLGAEQFLVGGETQVAVTGSV